MTKLYKRILLSNGREIEGPAEVVDSAIDFHGTRSIPPRCWDSKEGKFHEVIGSITWDPVKVEKDKEDKEEEKEDR